MGRSIKEIKDEMTAMFVRDARIVAAYGLDAAKTFDEQFSAVSIESILFYVTAAAQWTLEALFDRHRAEVTSLIEELTPHTLRWYASKAKAFMLGWPLAAETDDYDTGGMTGSEIAAARVVKFAAASESEGVVYLKIAGDTGGEPCPLEENEAAAFAEYIRQVKDAGVTVTVINEQPDHFRIMLEVYCNPMILDGAGMSFDGEFPVQDAIKSYIKNLPFNGEYRNADLIDVLQRIEGVEIPHLQRVETSLDGENWTEVKVKETPRSGYYRIREDAELDITFVANV
jgi:hypothetical protein